jgi:hypothetical protein
MDSEMELTILFGSSAGDGSRRNSSEKYLVIALWLNSLQRALAEVGAIEKQGHGLGVENCYSARIGLASRLAIFSKQ